MEESKPKQPKHTPGPWRSTNYWPRKIYGKDNRLVAVPILKHTGDWTKNCERCDANAVLISAAPELLECLKEAVLEYGCGNCIEQGDREVDCPYFDSESWRCSYDSECFGQQWLSAIRKAEGMEG